MEIIFNGKKVDADKLTVQDVFDAIFGKQYEDIPSVYNNPDEYLRLDDFNLFKCTTNEQLKDLSKKLKERLIWNEKHSNYGKENITDILNQRKANLVDCVNEFNNVVKACNMVIAYINQINNKK